MSWSPFGNPTFSNSTLGTSSRGAARDGPPPSNNAHPSHPRITRNRFLMVRKDTWNHSSACSRKRSAHAHCGSQIGTDCVPQVCRGCPGSTAVVPAEIVAVLAIVVVEAPCTRPAQDLPGHVVAVLL